MVRGAAFQKAKFSEPRCTDHIPKSLFMPGWLRCIAEVQARLSLVHNEWLLPIFWDLPRTAASEFRHRQVWAQPGPSQTHVSDCNQPVSRFSAK